MTTTRKQTPTVKIAATTPHEQAAINILTPQERKEALLQAAINKAAQLIEEDGNVA